MPDILDKELAYKEDIFFQLSSFDLDNQITSKLVNLVYNDRLEQRILELEEQIKK